MEKSSKPKRPRPGKPAFEQTTRFHLVLPGPLVARIEQAAQEQGTNKSEIIRRALADYLK